MHTTYQFVSTIIGRDWKRGVEENDEDDNKKDDKKEAEEKSTEKWRWVGLQTLRQWQTLASRCLEKNLPSSRFDENKLVKRCSRFCDHKKVILENDCVIEYSNYEEPMDDAELIEVASAASNTSASASTMNNFNEDIICDHGKLSTTKARRLVHPSLWKFFGEIFKQDSGYEESSQFTSDAKECEKCLVRFLEYQCFELCIFCVFLLLLIPNNFRYICLSE